MAKLTNYVVYRHGSNSSNQSLCDRLPVAVVEARSQAEACETFRPGGSDLHSSARLKLAPAINAWTNQYFTAKPLSRVSAEELSIAQEYERDQSEQDAQEAVGY